MAAKLSGNVEALKKLFENGNKTTANSFIGNGSSNGEMYKNSSEIINGSRVLSRNEHIPPKPAAKPFISRANLRRPSISDSESMTDSSKRENCEERSNDVPPHTKPKPILPKPLISQKPVVHVSNYLKMEKKPNVSTIGPIALGNRIHNVLSERTDAHNRTNMDPPFIIPPPCKNAMPDNSTPITLTASSAASSVPQSNQNPPALTLNTQTSLKKPPPVPKKPRSVLSEYVNVDGKCVQYKYYQALEEQFGLNVAPMNDDFTAQWARQQQEYSHIKQPQTTKLLMHRSSASGSVASSNARMSDTSYTNSSIRSILKKGRPALGVQKKSLAFKDDHELTTKYDYPPEKCMEDLESLDSCSRYRQSFDRDSDSSSTFDDSDDQDDMDYTGESSISTLRSGGGLRYITPSAAPTISTLKAPQPSRTYTAPAPVFSNSHPTDLKPWTSSYMTPSANNCSAHNRQQSSTFKRFATNDIRFHY